MKILTTLLLATFAAFQTQGQLLKKLKQKAEQAVNKTINQADSKPGGNADSGPVAAADGNKPIPAEAAINTPNLKVYSKFDFVPGSTILYYDNFEKDNIGEAPAGWITSTSAEVVTIDGLEGNWLKMASTSSYHVVRNKKQSWGDNFTAEFDLLIVKNSYDPRITISLINSGGKLVTDESILQQTIMPVYFEAILGDGGKQTRATLLGMDHKSISDNMSDNLPYSNTTPVHVSICVQGKRFRMWWNDRKLYDLPAVNTGFMPNQLGFSFGSVGGSEFYVSNIRVAKDIPDTRARFEEGKLISNLLFYTGTAKLKPESMGSLLDVSKVLKTATTPVKIVGHTDSDGDESANLKLSEQRADAVKDILVKEYGIDESKLTTEGRGETQPIAANNSAEGKAQNRRVEFIFNAAADKYEKPAGVTIPSGNAAKDAAKATPAKNTAAPAAGVNGVRLQSKILTINLPYAQILKEENGYVLVASKEEGNGKENFLKIHFKPLDEKLKADSYYFDVINQKKPLYGTKKYPAVTKTEAVLFYGSTQKPYIKAFSPYIAEGHMSKFVDASLARHLPAPSENCKLVVEKIADGKASGYFVMGNSIEGLKPVKIGDAEQETFTDGFAGEMKGTFTDIPVY